MKISLLALAALFIIPAHGQIVSGIMSPVTTRAYDNTRSGWDQNETKLTQNNVGTLHPIFNLPMEGDARGSEWQPLIQPSVVMQDGVKRDVVVFASMNNLVYAFDANDSDILWVTKLGNPVKGNGSIDMHGINDHWGCLSTGVIDPDTNILYAVCETSVDSSPQKGVYFVYSLNLSNGQFVNSPVPLADLTFQMPNGGPLQHWNSTMRKQRSALTLTNIKGVKTIFFGSGTVLETNNGAAGWVIAYDVASNKITATWATSDGGGIWMGGQGLAVDSNGYLYFMTGNGTFDPANGYYGESFMKLQYTPPEPTAALVTSIEVQHKDGTVTKTYKTSEEDIAKFHAANPPLGKLSPIGNWTPYTDAGRLGEGVTTKTAREVTARKLSGTNDPTSNGHMPTVHMSEGKPTNSVDLPEGKVIKPHFTSTPANNAGYGDEDLGSAGGVLLLDSGTYLGGGKDGIIYEVDINNMGNTQPLDFSNAASNYARLKQPPIWGSYFPGYGVSAQPQDPTTLNFLFDAKTRHLHSTPVVFKTATFGEEMCLGGENSNVRCFKVDPKTSALTYLAQGEEVASANITYSPGGMTGTMLTVSSNGTQPGTAILWAVMPYGDANATVTNGRLIAYDPEHFITYSDGSKGLKVLWDSQAEAIPFIFNKFDVPTIDGGNVYLPTYSDSVMVFTK